MVDNSQLLNALASHRMPSHATEAAELFRTFFECLGSPTQKTPDVSTGQLTYLLDLSNIRLKGMDEVPCLVLWTAVPAAADAIRAFYKDYLVMGRVLLVVA